MAEGYSPVDNHSAPERKIALFRSLFRGREDVFPRRFESRKRGRSGYSPACGNEWAQGVCEKPKVKCSQCPRQRFLALTDDVIRFHLEGQDDLGRDFVIGVYPILRDETCFFLAVDFDKFDWQEDVQAFRGVCRELGLPAAVERSRSGNGAHVWLFFDESLPAKLARNLGAFLLTKTMEHRPDIGLDSYDRLFPNQDTLPKGGLGNLIALPLQRRSRLRGNSVFVDDQLVPYPDQWVFLSQIRKMPRDKVEQIVHHAEKTGQVLGVRLVPDEEDPMPWKTEASHRRVDLPVDDQLPSRLEIFLANEVFIPKNELPPGLRNRLIRLAAFQNPEFYRAQAMRLPTYQKPRIIGCAHDYPLHIGLPRGCLDEVLRLLSELGIQTTLRDERQTGLPLDVDFDGQLRAEQRLAADALLPFETGVLCGTTAFGKTVVAAWMIAQRRVNTLVVVHRRQLLEQWVERLGAFLTLPESTIGALGGGLRTLKGKVDVALIQSLARKGVVDERVRNYGHLIVDECHHIPAHSFEAVARQSKARFILGLSATPIRKDGHHPIIFMQCGPIRFKVDARKQAAKRPFEHRVLVRPTDFRSLRPTEPDARLRFQDLYEELVADEKRNWSICEDVLESVRDGRCPLVLSERNEHLDILRSHLSGKVDHVILLRGGMGRRAMRQARMDLSAIPVGEGRVLLATGGFIGEGFDDPRLDTLFLTLPISWRGTIAQYVGRLHRLHEEKQEVRVYDYADLNVPMLARMFDRRCRGYEAAGYRILLPASALPGWPAEVPLPVDPGWKESYTASVRRLVRDGVDRPLADLFFRVTEKPHSDSMAIGGARSASEAFLFHRLETLPETAGRCQLNAQLPIAFNGCGTMEIDFLFPDAAVVLELDGPQHLDSPEAYRRDRRKDYLLQENGYLVLRFLAEDLGARLDDVIDAILRALEHRRTR